MNVRVWIGVAAACALASCATAPSQPAVTTPEQPAQPAAAAFALTPMSFDDLPGWASADLGPALTAFKRSCASRRLRAPDARLADNGRYGGSVADWQPACAMAEQVAPGGERAFFESQFIPHEVRGEGEARLTAYYEPIIQARRYPEPGFSEPLLRKPNDMVTVNLAAFAEAYDSEALRGAPRRLTGQLNGAEIRPYPKRGELSPAPSQAFAYAHPADVYNLQVQGSGRIAFPDGTQSSCEHQQTSAPSWLDSVRMIRKPSPPSVSGSKPWGRPIPSSSTAIRISPPGIVSQEILAMPAMPLGWAYLKALVSASLTISPIAAARVGARMIPGARSNDRVRRRSRSNDRCASRQTSRK